MKVETWNGHEIRFVEIEGEWWAIAKDIAEALKYKQTKNMLRLVPRAYTSFRILHGQVQRREYAILSEFGVYEAIFSSHKPQAEAFRTWIFEVIKNLRQASGIEGYEIFKLLDPVHQQEAMAVIQHNFIDPKPKNYIKANMITNKAVSIKFDLPKSINKKDMTPEMLIYRREILDQVVELMAFEEKHNLGISVSEKIYAMVEKEKGIAI